MSPSAAAAMALRADEERHWDRLLALVHPDALAHFVHHWRASVLMEEAIPEEGNEPEDPADVADERSSVREVFGVEGLAAFDALEPRELLRRFFLWKGRMASEHDMRPLAGTRQILGEVREGESTAHVIFRETRPSAPEIAEWFAPEVRLLVLTLRRSPEGWRVMLNGGLAFDDLGAYGTAPGTPVTSQA